MKSRFAWLTFAFFGGAIAFACGDEATTTRPTAEGDSGSPVYEAGVLHTQGVVTADKFGATLFSPAACNGALKACCDQDDMPYNEKACLERGKDAQEKLDRLLKLNPSLTFDATKAGSCIAHYHDSLAKCDGAFDMERDADCATFLRGSVAPGAECKVDNDCSLPAQGTAKCRFISSGVYKCIQYVPSTEGMMCDPIATSAPDAGPLPFVQGDCEDFEHKDFACDSATSTCVKLPGPGEKCRSTRCASHAGCVDGTCVARLDLGASCLKSAQCAAGLYCPQGDGPRACTKVKAPGEYCEATGECTMECFLLTGKCRTTTISLGDCTGQRGGF